MKKLKFNSTLNHKQSDYKMLPDTQNAKSDTQNAKNTVLRLKKQP